MTDVHRPLKATVVLAMLAVLGVAAARPRAQIIVSGGGDALDRALQNASHGDTLIVRAGLYSGALVGKGVTILCDAGVRFLSPTLQRFLVQGIPAGRVCVIRGGEYGPFWGGPDLWVADCAGVVVLDGVQTGRSFETRIERCASVLLRRCGLHDLRIVDSQASVTECFVDGDCPSGSGGPSCAAISVVRSTLAVAGGSVFGRDGQGPLAAAAPAFWLGNGTLTITGDPQTVIAGGALPVPAPVIASGSGSAIADDTMLGVFGNGRAPLVTGPAALARGPLTWSMGEGVRPAGTFTGWTVAPAGASAWTLLSFVRPPIATPFGSLWFDAGAPVIDAGVVPPGRVRSFGFRLPNAGPPGIEVVLQAVVVDAAGRLSLGAPAAAPIW